MARGRKKKPVEAKVIQGNFRKDRDPDPKDVPKAKPAKGLKPPFWLGKDAKEEWQRVAPELEAMGILANIDQQVLAGYCVACERLKAAEKEITEHGIVVTDRNGELRKNPAVNVQVDALRMINAFAAQFGLSASARTSLAITPKARTPDGKGKTPAHGKAQTASRILD